ncbi:GroES-like protein [Hypoxylon trugodes]|uniref:GroES-like protein n=1 Tax=Hypoxylon trugodes TaxID=326681 RepID=UPI00218CF16C|nr:GroES-like protein [Hypoxylon trugodes]KAI1384020.1 GroES-like protein [Hypoxylon trugodes]
MSELPSTMRSLVAPKYCLPNEWEVAEVPVPTIKDPKDILIKVHAASISTGDTQLANGASKLLIGGLRFPHKIGIEASGTVVATGSDVTLFKPGDTVWAFAQKHPMDLLSAPGFTSEYAVATEQLTLHKPRNASFEEACNTSAILVAVQTISMGLRLMRENGVTEGLEGKTVFVSGALSATGSAAVQVLKNVYGVGKIITTVSTAKVPLVETYLPGLADQVVDYTKYGDLTDAIPPGTVDFVYNTQWDLLKTFPLLKPDVGVVASIASVPAPSTLRKMLPPLPFFVYWLTGLAQWWYAFKLRGTRVKHEFLSGNMGIREDLERAGEILAMGKVKPVLTVVELGGVEAVRREAQKVATGKGGLGKLVIKIA